MFNYRSSVTYFLKCCTTNKPGGLYTNHKHNLNYGFEYFDSIFFLSKQTQILLTSNTFKHENTNSHVSKIYEIG